LAALLSLERAIKHDSKDFLRQLDEACLIDSQHLQTDNKKKKVPDAEHMTDELRDTFNRIIIV
jgi:hypothetical protein